MKFREGDIIEVIDEKGKKFVFSLKKGEKFHFHLGFLDHNEILGKEEGNVILTSKKKKVFVFKVDLASYVLKMGRGAQIIYPKDIGQIIIKGEIFPGLKVLEAGTGSGALTLFLLRILGEKGALISYEKREDFLKIAKKNIKRFLGKLPENLILRRRDIYKEGITQKDFNLDRIIFDLAEPWNALSWAKKALKAGGILLCYNPTVGQMLKTKNELEKIGGFYFKEMTETLEREWKIEKRIIRPKERMVAHTGFILVAKRLAK